MALNSTLIKFKAPGTKILTEIKENLPQAEAPSGSRILVINSKKGPVNTLTLVSTFAEYKRLFDDISDADERRGNWGARSAEYMLSVAPIYVLNLRAFDDEKDKAGYQELSTMTNVKNGLGKLKPYSKLYNTSQLWKIDPDALIDIRNTDKLLTFANIGVSNLSVFVRRTRTKQSTITFDQWYKNLGKEMPAYLPATDTVDSWFVDVVIFKNTFNATSSTNPVYGYLFNVDGTVKKTVVDNTGREIDALTQLTEIAESGYIGTITGSLVQGFTDERLNDSDIVTVLNSMVNTTGLVVARNEAIYDGAAIWYEDDTYASNGKKKPISVDMKGHNLANTTSTESFAITSVPAKVNSLSYAYDVKVSKNPVNTFAKENVKFVDDVVISKEQVIEVAKFDEVITPVASLIPAKLVSTPTEHLEAADRSKLYILGDSARPNVGDSFVGRDGNLATVKSAKNVKTIKVLEHFDTNELLIQPSGKFKAADGQETYEFPSPGAEYPKHDKGYYVYPNNHPLAGYPVFFKETLSTTQKLHEPFMQIKTGLNAFVDARVGKTATELINEFITANATYTQGEDTCKFDEMKDATLTAKVVEKYAKSQYVYEVAFDTDLAFNKVADQENEAIYSNEQSIQQAIKLDNGTLQPVYFAGYSYFVKNADDATVAYNAIALNAYKMRKEQFLDGTAERQNKVLDMLLDRSILSALSNRDLTNWNYIVDGFKSYIEPNIKYQLKDVAKARIIARAIYNMPSILDFQKSTNPYFSETIGGTFEPKYIPQGGNLQLPYNNTFSIPSVDGWFAYGFGPNLKLSGSTKTMPPAAVVSNLFQQKHLSGKPYTILAGRDAGAIRAKNVSGVEYVFNESNNGDGDRDYLDPFGYNVIVHKKSGLQLYGNKTSHNTVSTPVSAIHSSEVLMFIQQRINSLLENFVFKLNNSQNRLVLKNQADAICEEPLNAGAISGYVNVIDATNNTPEIIANKMGILDTTLFDANGMEILVHRTTFDTVTNMASYSIVRSNL